MRELLSMTSEDSMEIWLLWEQLAAARTGAQTPKGELALAREIVMDL